MNAGGDFRYATRGGGEDFLRWRTWQNLAANLKALPTLPPPPTSLGVPPPLLASQPGTPGEGGADARRLRSQVGCGCGVGASGGGQVAAGDKWAGSTEWEARAAALSPGGPFTRRFFAHRPIALQVGARPPPI